MARTKKEPHAVAAHYDRRLQRIVVDLASGLSVMFRPQDAEDLCNPSTRALSVIEVSPSGYGIYFPKLDVDLSVPGILHGLFGTRRWMAAQLGQSGGKATSKAKTQAARENGKLGGRPRKRQSA